MAVRGAHMVEKYHHRHDIAVAVPHHMQHERCAVDGRTLARASLASARPSVARQTYPRGGNGSFPWLSLSAIRPSLL